MEPITGGVSGWSSVPNGTLVVEDTYNELYVLFRKKDKMYPILRHIGWRYAHIKRKEVVNNLPLHDDREADFEPDCIYDQPWYMETK